jgi:hypothetical protein
MAWNLRKYSRLYFDIIPIFLRFSPEFHSPPLNVHISGFKFFSEIMTGQSRSINWMIAESIFFQVTNLMTTRESPLLPHKPSYAGVKPMIRISMQSHLQREMKWRNVTWCEVLSAPHIGGFATRTRSTIGGSSGRFWSPDKFREVSYLHWKTPFFDIYEAESAFARRNRENGMPRPILPDLLQISWTSENVAEYEQIRFLADLVSQHNSQLIHSESLFLDILRSATKLSRRNSLKWFE